MTALTVECPGMSPQRSLSSPLQNEQNSELTFCLPTENDITAIRNRVERLIGEKVERELPVRRHSTRRRTLQFCSLLSRLVPVGVKRRQLPNLTRNAACTFSTPLPDTPPRPAATLQGGRRHVRVARLRPPQRGRRQV